MTTAQNKEIVQRINKEFIEGGDVNSVYEIFAPDFINHTAPPGSPQGPEAIIYYFNHMLKPAFPDLKVKIHDMIAEGDKVTTRKSFYATHEGEFFGMAATHKKVVMDVIDVIQLREGKFVGHWGILDMHSVMTQLSS